jgi:hypothetical protein
LPWVQTPVPQREKGGGGRGERERERERERDIDLVMFEIPKIYASTKADYHFGNVSS